LTLIIHDLIIIGSSNIKEIKDVAGRPRIVFTKAENPTRDFDRVIFALGGTTPTNSYTRWVLPLVATAPFDEAGATNVAGLYLIGDLVVSNKGGSIITAFNSAVHAMKKHLRARFALQEATRLAKSTCPMMLVDVHVWTKAKRERISCQVVSTLEIYWPHGKEKAGKSLLYLFVEIGFWSGREDSNLRPLGPKPSALPGCATPRNW
jgi:hypothetical protein